MLVEFTPHIRSETQLAEPPPMDPLHLGIALGPLATYFLVLGAINLSLRPVLVSGGRDAAALALALIGLVVAGPMELFLVEEAAVLYGGWVWAIMVAAYLLFAALIVLMLRPRLVIYNATLDQVRPIVADVVSRLERDARWAGESVILPQLGVHLHFDVAPFMKNVQLVSSGPQQNLHGWHQLETELRTALKRAKTTPNLYGTLFIGCGILLVAAISLLLARDPAGVMQTLTAMLRR
jgi:hypothetical protein